MRRSERLFAFFGADLPDTAGALRTLSSHEYGLLALDADAVARCVEQGLEYSTVDDWLDGASMMAAKKRAIRWGEEWFTGAPDALTIDGVCWPKIDREAMYWFWLSASVATAVGESFLEHEIRELTFPKRATWRPAVYYSRSDVHLACWTQLLAGTVTLRGLPAHTRSIRTTASRALSAVARAVRRISPSISAVPPVIGRVRELAVSAPRDGRGTIVVALNPAEVYRHGAQVLEIKKTTGTRVVIIPTAASTTELETFVTAHEIEIQYLGQGAVTENERAPAFAQGFACVVEETRDKDLVSVLKACRYHFDHYTGTRWPRLARQLSVWKDVLSTNDIRALVVSSLPDAESQLPALSARESGVPSLPLPHGVGLTRKIQLQTSVILHAFGTDREALRRAGNEHATLVGCRDCMTTNEYPVTALEVDALRSPGRRILVLLATTFRPGVIWPSIAPNSQVSAITSLFENSGGFPMRFVFKPHPNLPDLSLLRGLGAQVRDAVLPADVPLEEALRASELVIALNYSGVGIVHAALQGKPVIFYWTDPCIGETEPCSLGDIYLPCGPLVRDAKSLWQLLNRFAADEAYAASLAAQAREFAATRLDNTSYPSLAEVVAALIADSPERGTGAAVPFRSQTVAANLR